MNPNLDKYLKYFMDLKTNPQTKLTVSYAGVLFDKKIQMGDKLQKIDKKKIQKLLKPAWYIHEKSYAEQGWPQIFSYIVQAKCQTLFLYANMFPDIIKTIESPQWSKLHYLNLSCNKITNNEALAFLNMPIVQQISLANNHISNVKTFNKLALRKLGAIYIDDNQIQEMEFGRILFNEQKRVIIRISNDNRSFYEGLFRHAKLKSTSNMYLFHNRLSTYKQNALTKSIRRKYDPIK